MSNSKKNAQNPDCERGCSEKNRDESFLDYIKNQIVTGCLTLKCPEVKGSEM